MSSILVLGDPHIGKGLSIGKSGVGQLNSRIVDQLNILEWVRQQAIENNVSDIVCCGDEFEAQIVPASLISMLLEWLKSCTDQNIKVHMIMGNHSLIRSGQFHYPALDVISSAEIDGVSVYKDITSIELNDMSITFVPFRDRRSFNTDSNAMALNIIKANIQEECKRLDDRNIKVAILHLSLEGSLPVVSDEIDDYTNELFMPLDTFKDYDYTFAGHIHKPTTFSDKPFIAHIGSMDISNFGEANHKKHIAIINPKTQEKLKFIEIPSRPLKSINVSIPADTKDTTSYAIQELEKQNLDLSKAIVKLHILLEASDLLNVDKNIVEKYLMDLGAFYVPRIDQERKISQIKKHAGAEEIDNMINEAAAIKMYAVANIEKNLQNDFIALANSIIQETNASN